MQPEEIYRPPQADLEIQTPAQSLRPQTRAPFFQTALWKMGLLSVMSLGLYQLYWFHKQWWRRKIHGENVTPILRTIFGVLFAYSLFANVNRHIIERSAPADLPLDAGVPLLPLSAGLLALGYFGLSLLWQLPDVLGIFAGLLSILPLMAAQRKINQLHAALGYDAKEGTRLSGGDVAVLVIGGLFWLLILFVPFQA